MNKAEACSSRKIRGRVAWLVLTVLVLLSHTLQSTMGSAYYSLAKHDHVSINSPPVILQSGTAGSSSIYMNGTSALASAVAPAPTPTYYPNSYNPLSENWWNSNYDYRMEVTVTNNIASTISADYSVLLTLGTVSLVSAGKMLSNGNDLRILYWNSSSFSWLELDRAVEDMNTASTKVWFSTQTSIAASASDSNYYMYYGYSSAGTPPANKNVVYSFWNDFESLTGWTHRKTSEGGTLGTVSVSGSVLTITPGDATYADYVIHDSFTTSDSEGFCIRTRARERYGSSGEDDMIVAVFFVGIDGNGDVNNDYNTRDKPSQSRIVRLIGGASTVISTGTGNVADTWYTYDTFRKPTGEMKLLRDESQVCPASGWSSHSSLSSGYIGVGAEGNSRDYDFDWILVRKYVDPEPSTSLESERARVISWHDPGWSYRKKIVINHSQVQADETAFPVLINLTSDSDLASNSQSNGNDILFTSSNGVTKLSHEIENYTSTTGALIAWVKVPSLSSSIDTYLFMYHGNSTCGSQQNVTDVWDSNFKGVWHLKEDPSGTAPQMKDSTSDGNDGTSYGTMTTSDQVEGKIGGSLDLDGGNDEIRCGNAASLQIVTELTIEAWATAHDNGATEGIVNKVTSSTYNGYQLRKHSDNYYRFAIGNPGTAGQYVASDSAYTDSNWHYIVGVRRSGTNYLYIDGVQQTATFTYAITDSGSYFDIGRAYSNYDGFWWDGVIDEVRVSNTGRNASWIATCYNNQNSPSTFYAIGALEENPRVSGTIPASIQMVDSDYFVVRSTGTATSTTGYNPSGYNLNGSTTLVSGTTSDLVSNNGAYMTFRSYASATSATLYAHQETTTIGSTSYYLLNDSSADAGGTTLSASGGTTGRKLMGRFVKQLTGVSSIPASTWTIYYRAYRSNVFGFAAHGDVNILIRMSDDTVRATVASNVANSGALGTSWSTVSGTYAWAEYTVVDETDYLEIDYYIEVTDSASGSVYLRIDDSGLATTSQTRATNISMPSEYTSEVEFTGSSNTEPWSQLVWSTDTAWTTGSVTVTIQVYNYTLNGYPTSGNGYASYTSSSTANTDETTSQTMTTSPTHFRNESGNWKIKVKGAKTTTSQFDFKADWVEFKPTHTSEYTVSTEFLFSGMTTNTPAQLHFTVISEYNITSVNVTIQVWNYSSSAYVTSGEGYSAYTSTGTNVTANLNISTSPQSYVSSGNAKIIITGKATTSSQHLQQINQVKLAYVYTASPDYNYLLGITENHGANWKVRLKAYNQSNMGRLSNCSIYIYNGSNSTQITISSGAYTQQTGPWYDLTASDIEYIWMHVEASSTDTSYVYLYLEILVPNTTTYSQCILTFVIT